MNRFMGIILVACSGFVFSCNAIADPNSIQIGFSCPNTSGTGPYNLSNFGWRIAGYGQEFINGTQAPNLPYFNFGFTSGNFPSIVSMGAYSSSGTQYDPATGVVGCIYTSANGFDSFVATYEMTNGNGGYVISQTQNTIVINQYVGLK